MTGGEIKLTQHTNYPRIYQKKVNNQVYSFPRDARPNYYELRGLRTTEDYLSRLSGDHMFKSQGVGKAALLPKSKGENPSLLLPASGSFGHFFGSCLHNSNPCFCSTKLSPLRLCLPLFSLL